MNGREAKPKGASKSKSVEKSKGAAASASASNTAPSKKGKGKGGDDEDEGERRKAQIEQKKKEEEEKHKKKMEKKALEEGELAANTGAAKKGTRENKVAARREKHVEEVSHELREIDEVSASGIDAALDVTTEVNLQAKGKGANLERHPERRVKAAYAAFVERRLPELKEELPGLRKSQYDDALQNEWKKEQREPNEYGTCKL